MNKIGLASVASLGYEIAVDNTQNNNVPNLSNNKDNEEEKPAITRKDHLEKFIKTRIENPELLTSKDPMSNLTKQDRKNIYQKID